mgnify:CR=1 FL=1
MSGVDLPTYVIEAISERREHPSREVRCELEQMLLEERQERWEDSSYAEQWLDSFLDLSLNAHSGSY